MATTTAAAERYSSIAALLEEYSSRGREWRHRDAAAPSRKVELQCPLRVDAVSPSLSLPFHLLHPEKHLHCPFPNLKCTRVGSALVQCNGSFTLGSLCSIILSFLGGGQVRVTKTGLTFLSLVSTAQETNDTGSAVGGSLEIMLGARGSAGEGAGGNAAAAGEAKAKAGMGSIDAGSIAVGAQMQYVSGPVEVQWQRSRKRKKESQSNGRPSETATRKLVLCMSADKIQFGSAAVDTVAAAAAEPPLDGTGNGAGSGAAAAAAAPILKNGTQTPASSRPALLFDLSYNSRMNSAEANALCRQLTMSYAANRKAAAPFKLIVAGDGVGASTGIQNDEGGGGGGERTGSGERTGVAADGQRDPSATAAAAGAAEGRLPELVQMLNRQGWLRWQNITRVNTITRTNTTSDTTANDEGAPRGATTTPWSGINPETITYLTADSETELDAITPGHTYIVGGLVDHTDKPLASFSRAKAAGLKTARLPIGRFAKFRSRQQPKQHANSGEGGGGAGGAGSPHLEEKGVDVTTLAVVQMMLLFREHQDWGDAISKCPAMHCAPMRKYITWLEPYTHLNEAARPTKLV